MASAVQEVLQNCLGTSCALRGSGPDTSHTGRLWVEADAGALRGKGTAVPTMLLLRLSPRKLPAVMLNTKASSMLVLKLYPSLPGVLWASSCSSSVNLLGERGWWDVGERRGSRDGAALTWPSCAGSCPVSAPRSGYACSSGCTRCLQGGVWEMSPDRSTCPASTPSAPHPGPIPPPLPSSTRAQGCIPTLAGQDGLSEAEDEGSEQQGEHLRDPAKGTQPHTRPVTAPQPGALWMGPQPPQLPATQILRHPGMGTNPALSSAGGGGPRAGVEGAQQICILCSATPTPKAAAHPPQAEQQGRAVGCCSQVAPGTQHCCVAPAER